MFCQVSPASVERYTPFPRDTLERMWASPVPAHTTLGSDGDTARAPMEWAFWSSKIGSQLTPASEVF